ncbi:uncharacterized protein LOC141614521 [Silene latifolia]|uniref:uncharacterized protein LOC141614521 n=1 Tax=Silene latifolia TaxID=37657 RepID=UPI003D77320C
MVYASNNARVRDDLWGKQYFSLLADILDFNSCLLKCGLDDLNSTGCDMTWTNNQDIETLVWSKLDRALVNTQWMAQFPATAAHFPPPGISDHSPGIVTVFEDKYVGPRFSFLNCWVDHPSYHDYVLKAWQTPVHGSKFFTLFSKLKHVRTQMKALHKQSFSQIQQRVKDSKEALHECQRQIQANLQMPELYAQEKLLLDTYMKLKRAKGNIIQQKAKVHHISYSDSSSKYFFARIHERKHQQIIGQIKDKDGHDRVGLGNVALGFIDYYQHLLGSSTVTQPIDVHYIQQGSCVPAEDFDFLIKHVTDAEIKADVFRIGSDKSHVPDGFSSAFFKASWDLVGPDFCTAVHAYFRHGRLSKQANATLITLIPKKKVSSTVMDFRPISCCITFYKAINKILSTRLQTILPKIIGPEQAAFIKKRNIHENIMMSQSLVKGYGRKYLTPRCLIKVDIRKAFDSLQWCFIQAILKALKFPEVFVNWIMGCITRSWFSLKINGSVHGFFQGKSGLRGDVPSVSAVLKVLESFSTWSGLYANTEKTEIYFGGVSDAVKQHILQDTGFSEGNFPFRYLGLPLNTARLTVDSYGVLINQIQSFLQHWATRFFSYAGKIQLINSVIFVLTNFWRATALLPKNIIKAFNKLCKDFFWSIEDGQRRLVKKSGLWFEWTQAYYLTNSSIWTVQSKNHYTESLRSLLIIRDDLLAKTGSITNAISLLSSWFHNGKFSLSQAYSWFRNNFPMLHWTAALNHQFIIPSHRVITSLDLQHKLATLDNFARKGLSIINRCIFCKQDNEKHAHLFFNCVFSSKIWECIQRWLQISGRSSDAKSELLWSSDRRHGRHWKNGWVRASIAATCYYLWEERNSRVFNGFERTSEQLLHVIRVTVSSRVLSKISCLHYEMATRLLAFGVLVVVLGWLHLVAGGLGWPLEVSSFMPKLVRFHCPFSSLHACPDGFGKGLTKAAWQKHFQVQHCHGGDLELTRQTLVDSLTVFSNAESTLKRMGLWLCGRPYVAPSSSQKKQKFEDRPYAPRDQGQAKKDMICIKCGKAYHPGKYCDTGNPVTCFTCKAPGHKAIDCPQKPKFDAPKADAPKTGHVFVMSCAEADANPDVGVSVEPKLEDIPVKGKVVA